MLLCCALLSQCSPSALSLSLLLVWFRTFLWGLIWFLPGAFSPIEGNIPVFVVVVVVLPMCFCIYIPKAVVLLLSTGVFWMKLKIIPSFPDGATRGSLRLPSETGRAAADLCVSEVLYPDPVPYSCQC